MKILPDVAVLPGVLSFVIFPNMTGFGTMNRFKSIKSILSGAPSAIRA
jgi:hypothetical protein